MMRSKLIGIWFLFVLAFGLALPTSAYSDWASPKVISKSTEFIYNGVKYGITYVDSIGSSRAGSYVFTLLQAAGKSKIAIPMRALGWVGVVASIGYVVYDMSTTLQTFKSTVYGMPLSSGVGYACPYSSGQGGYSWAMMNSQSIRYGTYSAQGTFPRWNVYFLGGNCSGIVRMYSGIATSDLRVYAERVYIAQDCSVPFQTACSSAVPYVYPEKDVKDWVEAHPDLFQPSPYFSRDLPSDAIEFPYPPEAQTRVSQNPEGSLDPQEGTSPEERPLPQPADPDTQYIDPGDPAIPGFDTSVDVPEKKRLEDILETWYGSLPFLSFFSNVGISGSGNCSFVIPTPFGGSGVMDFCRFSDTFSTIGDFVLAFAGIYAIYIIFVRGD